MFDTIKGFIQSDVEKPISKESTYEFAKETFSAINNYILPTLKEVYHSEEFMNSPNVDILIKVGDGLRLNTRDPKEVINALIEFFKEVNSEEARFLKLIDKNVSDTIFPQLATARDIAILKTLSDLSSVCLFTLDLIYFVTIKENETEFPKKRIEMLNNSIPYYTSIIRTYYKHFDKHIKDLEKVSIEVVKPDAPSTMMDKLFAKTGKLVSLGMLNGFINNPIYHVRLWLADRDIQKYEALKEKKKLLELKLLDLKMKNQGKHDAKLEKQIKYYEDKIAGIEYEIKELEDDFE